MSEKESTRSFPHDKKSLMKDSSYFYYPEIINFKDMDIKMQSSEEDEQQFQSYFDTLTMPHKNKIPADGTSEIKYTFDENKYLQEITSYINKTYSQHYSQGKYQATDTIIDAGWGEGFCLGNIIKYCKRYGKKDGNNKADLLKIIHYAIIQLYIHDTANKE